jgi:cytochrome P450
MTQRRRPPGPTGTFLGGNLPEFRRDRLAFYVNCARAYGDVVAVRFGYRRVYIVNHPDLIESVLVTQARHFIKHWALRLNPLVLGKGLLTSEGDFWLRQRRLMQPAFQKNRVTAYAGSMVEAAQRMLARWRPGERREILTEMSRLTLEIAAKTLFDADVTGDAADVGAALQVLLDNFLRRFSSLVPVPLWVPTPANLRLRRAVRRLDAIIYRFIEERRQSHDEKGDLLSLLLHARDELDQSGMTDRQLRDEAMTLFLAGHETTALTLAWTWYLLATHEGAAARVADEVDAVVGDRPPTAEDLPRLRYVESVILESMRLYPPAYVIGREAVADCEVGGYHVPRGLTIMLPQWSVHRDPRYYDDPEKFRPERWLEGLAQRLPRYAYFPFGGGPRLCIGNHFAQLETVLVLAVLARHYRFTLADAAPVRPAPTFTLRPDRGIVSVLTPREVPVRTQA